MGNFVVSVALLCVELGRLAPGRADAGSAMFTIYSEKIHFDPAPCVDKATSHLAAMPKTELSTYVCIVYLYLTYLAAKGTESRRLPV